MKRCIDIISGDCYWWSQHVWTFIKSDLLPVHGWHGPSYADERPQQREDLLLVTHAVPPQSSTSSRGPQISNSIPSIVAALSFIACNLLIKKKNEEYEAQTCNRSLSPLRALTRFQSLSPNNQPKVWRWPNLNLRTTRFYDYKLLFVRYQPPISHQTQPRPSDH